MSSSPWASRPRSQNCWKDICEVSECKHTAQQSGSSSGALQKLQEWADESLAKSCSWARIIPHTGPWPGCLAREQLCRKGWAGPGTKQCPALQAASVNYSAGCISKGWSGRWGKGSFLSAQHLGEQLGHQSGVPQDRSCVWEFSAGLPGQLQGWSTWQRQLGQHGLQKGGLRQPNCIFFHLTKGYRDWTRRYRVTGQGATAKSCPKVNSGSLWRVR